MSKFGYLYFLKKAWFWNQIIFNGIKLSKFFAMLLYVILFLNNDILFEFLQCDTDVKKYKIIYNRVELENVLNSLNQFMAFWKCYLPMDLSHKFQISYLSILLSLWIYWLYFIFNNLCVFKVPLSNKTFLRCDFAKKHVYKAQ